MKVFGIAGYSNSGKTTLVENIIPVLKKLGSTCSVIKHAHHSFDIDIPGKDSYRHREAGAKEVLVSSSRRWALVHELKNDSELKLCNLLKKLSDCDLVIIEGFKGEKIPKIEIIRDLNQNEFLFPFDANIKAIVSDREIDTKLPIFRMEDYFGVGNFVNENAGTVKL